MKMQFRKAAFVAVVFSALIVAPASSARVVQDGSGEGGSGWADLTYCPATGPICTRCIGNTEWSICFPVAREVQDEVPPEG